MDVDMIFSGDILSGSLITADPEKAANIRQSEDERKRKPTRNELRDTIKYLKDFNLHKLLIPDFNTVSEMLRWRKDMVCKLLDKI